MTDTERQAYATALKAASASAGRNGEAIVWTEWRDGHLSVRTAPIKLRGHAEEGEHEPSRRSCTQGSLL